MVNTCVAAITMIVIDRYPKDGRILFVKEMGILRRWWRSSDFIYT